MSSARASRLHYAPLPPRDHCHQRTRDASDAVAFFARHLTNAGPVSRGHFGSKLRRRALLARPGHLADEGARLARPSACRSRGTAKPHWRRL